jgi:hypothetical protein
MAVINGVTIPLKDYPDGANGTGVYNAPAGGPFTYYTDKTNPNSITCAAFAYYVMDKIWGDNKRTAQPKTVPFDSVSAVKTFFTTQVSVGMMIRLLMRKGGADHYIVLAEVDANKATATFYDSNSQGDNIVHYMTRDFGKIQELFSSSVAFWKNGA